MFDFLFEISGLFENVFRKQFLKTVLKNMACLVPVFQNCSPVKKERIEIIQMVEPNYINAVRMIVFDFLFEISGLFENVFRKQFLKTVLKNMACLVSVF